MTDPGQWSDGKKVTLTTMHSGEGDGVSPSTEVLRWSSRRLVALESCTGTRGMEWVDPTSRPI